MASGDTLLHEGHYVQTTMKKISKAVLCILTIRDTLESM